MGTEQTTDIKRFKQVREENGFTQAEFAGLLGINNSTADIERGKTKLSGKVVAELLKQFGINPLWLFGESHIKFIAIENRDVSPKVITLDAAGNDNIVLVLCSLTL